MALPGNLSTVTVTGKYLNFQGSPIRGQVRFTLSNGPLVDASADTIIVPTTVTANLDENGAFSVVLPATDDPDVYPEVVSYTVTEAFAGGRTYSLSLPAAVPTVDLTSVAPVPSLSPIFIALTTEGFWNPLVAQIDALRDSVDPETGDFIASGAYTFLPLAYSTYTAFNAAYATYTALNNGMYSVPGSVVNAFSTQAQTAATTSAAAYSTAVSAAESLLNPFSIVGG